MRNNQVSIQIERLGSEAPEGARVQRISAYGDANNIWEALSAAVNEATKEILRDRPQASFQQAESISHVYGPKERVVRFPEEKEAIARQQELIWQTGEELQAAGRTDPIFCDGIGKWVMRTRTNRVLYGELMYIIGVFTRTKLYYHYDALLHGVCCKRLEASDLEDVVRAMLRDPENTSVEAYTKDYSPNELSMLRELKERLLAGETVPEGEG